MIIVRFKVKSKPEKSDQLRAAFEKVVAPSRVVNGVLNFDIAEDLTEPGAFIATEVFADRAALQQQEALLEVKRVLDLLPETLASEPEATLYHVSSAEPWGE